MAKCPHKPGSNECLSWPCNGVYDCDGVPEFEMPVGVVIHAGHPIFSGERVGPTRPRPQRRVGEGLNKPKRVTIEVKAEIADLLVALDREHCYSCDKWGHDFDDHNTINDWVSYINQYLALATPMDATDAQVQAGFTKAMNLCLSALAARGRNGKFAPRHYDEVPR